MKKNNKKRQLPLLLLALLLISLGAYGTQAYFTDAANDKVGLMIKLGTVDVNLKNEGWNANETNGQLTSEDAKTENGEIFGKSFTNALPGNSFTNTFTISNDGTLNQNVTFDKNELTKIHKAIKETPGFIINMTFTGDLGKGTEKKPFTVDDLEGFADGKPTIPLKAKGNAVIEITVTVADKTNQSLDDKDSLNKTKEEEGLNILDLLTKSISVTAEEAN